MSSKPETKTKGMCIATRCTNVDQFVQMFHRFVDEQSFFVSTLNTRPPGLETSFSVQLADGTPVLRGLCVVQQAWTTPANPFKTPGVRLGIKRLTAQSTPVFQRLLASRNAAKKPPGAPSLATVVIPKPGTPKPIAKSPFTETAPAVSAPSRVELKQPARAISVPTIVTPERASTGDAIPRAVTVETTDVMEEKTDVREPQIPVASIPASPPQSPGGTLAAKLAATPAKPVDVKEVAKPLRPAEPMPDDARTPGSDLVLPANPLMNLSDESLEGYVDCTLYEETGTFFPADDDTAFPDDLAPPPPPSDDAAKPEAAQEPRDATSDASLARGSAPVLPAPVAAASVPQPPAEAAKQTADDAPSIVIESEPGTPSKLPLAPPTHDSAPVVAAPVAVTPVMVPTRRKRPSWWLVGGGAGALVLGALGIVMVTSSSGGARSPATPPAAKPTVVASVPPAEPTREVQVARPPVDEVEEPEEPTGEGPPTVGSGPCKVVVHTTPAGSIVKLDGTTVGPSPITVAASCDKHKVDVVHPRYAAQSKQVTLSAGSTETLEVTLSRPTHIVTVTSNPSGAQIFIDGRSAGMTPTKLNVLGFTMLKLEFKKTGYQPANAKLYSKRPQDSVSVKLQRW